MDMDDGAEVKPPAYGPAAGALLMAFRLAGRRTDPVGAPHGV
jgi:hypothetical protein